MTDERDKRIAEAVAEAAAKLVDVGPHSAGEFYASQIRALDLDAIIASVPGPELTVWGYSDEDECMGDTLDEYAKQRGLVIGDSFEVTEQWSRDLHFEIVGGGPTASDPNAEFVFKSVDRLQLPKESHE